VTGIRVVVPNEVRGRRILLRPLRLRDARAVWDAIEESRGRLEPWMAWARQSRSPEGERAAIRRMRERWRSREDLTVGIFDRASGRFLGGSGLHRINWALRTFEIGYWIRTDAEGKGYVTEAVGLLTRLAFDRLGANRVEIRMDPRNHRSRAVAERLGFRLEGTLRWSALGADGRPEDRQVFALTRDDYARVPWRVAEQPAGARQA